VRPALSLAAALVIAAAGMLALSERTQAQPQPLAETAVAEAIGLPEPMSGYAEPGGTQRAEPLMLLIPQEQR
jgi:hypothetical protein